ncbi:MAG: hypothetical protein Q8J68_02405 [Methanolobus sp.]|uniref:hypothetical protein n=1 Tax=Methanolobus sp. TaxID=1874737 RepID=UPI002732282F|nr:hypothetical protein [Methanolobus sp.]MDP2216126.1 hypothetical protein [Methanolobus sp.]
MNRKQAITVGVIIAGILLFSNFALATNAESIDERTFADLSGTDDLYNELEEQVIRYNERVDDVPGIIKRIAGDDVILMTITTDDGEELYVQAITNNGEILYFERVSSPGEVDPSITVTTDEETTREIIDSSEPFNEFTDALDRDEISVETENTLKRIALGSLMTANRFI